VREAQRTLQRLQAAMVADYGARIPYVDAAIQNLDAAMGAIERQCAGEPPGYDPRPTAAEVAELVVGAIALDADSTAAREPESADEERPPHVVQSVLAVRELWKAIDLSVATNASYGDRLQQHVADAAHHCHDVDRLLRAYAVLRGVGAAESDVTSAISDAVQMSDDLCAALEGFSDAMTGEDTVALDEGLLHFLRRAMSPHLAQLPSDDELRNFVANERAASKRGRPRRDEEGSKKPDRLEDVASLLGLNADNHDSIRRMVNKHRTAVKKRVQARKISKSQHK
jgi:hypothetical protein